MIKITSLVKFRSFRQDKFFLERKTYESWYIFSKDIKELYEVRNFDNLSKNFAKGFQKFVLNSFKKNIEGRQGVLLIDSEVRCKQVSFLEFEKRDLALFLSSGDSRVREWGERLADTLKEKKNE